MNCYTEGPIKVLKQRCALPFDMLSTFVVCVTISSMTYIENDKDGV